MKGLLLFTLGLLCVTACFGSPRPEQPLLIRNARIISMTPGQTGTLEGHYALIANGRLQAVAPDSELRPPEGAAEIDATGAFLLPGLIDMHVHVWGPADLKAYPSFGVTTVRNLSGMPFHLDAQKRIEAGTLIGPRLFTSGPILNSPGPNAQANHKIVTTAEEARQAVRDQREAGYELVKVYSNLTREAYEAVLDEARALGMEITGHPPEGVRSPGAPFEAPFDIAFEELLDDGFQCFEHMESIVWHALGDELDIDQAREVARQIASAGVPVDPTLIAHHNLLAVAASQGSYLERPGVQLLNPFISSFERDVFDFWSRQPRDTRRDFEDFYLNATKIFQEEGVLLVAGSDAGIFTNIPGDALLQELELLARAGLTPRQVLETATVNAAKVLGRDNELGQVAPGFAADLILVDEDPLQSPAALRSLQAVVMRGAHYDKAALARLREEAAQASFEATQARVMEALDAQGTEL